MSRHLFGRVLDVGCGIGDFLHYSTKATGVDVNPYIVRWCKDQGMDVYKMSDDHLPFGDSEFESVVLDNVLEHLAEPTCLLSEIYRVLVPGGRLLVGVPGESGYRADPDHKVYYNEADLVKMVTSSGFNTVGSFHTPVKSAWLSRVLPQYCLYGIFERLLS